jgi:hypothetical protein
MFSWILMLLVGLHLGGLRWIVDKKGLDDSVRDFFLIDCNALE